IVDTGGIGITDVDNLTADVEKQIEHAIHEAAVILFLVDAREGAVALDQLVAERLRKVSKPVVLIANKCDSVELEPHASDFFPLGYPKVLPARAHHPP